ncbi:MAG: amino acid ABC transporter permease [Hyphomicrobiales bacterium]|nr:amino acid ABC transporter permease [Hyphomicrobiales bacterium]
MSASPNAAAAYVRIAAEPDLPPPLLSRGAIAWARVNLFSSLWSSLVTLALVALAIWLLPQLVAWATTRAIWSAPDGALCRANQDGACWAFIAHKFDYLRYGSYPVAERWRIVVVEIVGAALIAWLLWPGGPRRGVASALFFLAFPILGFVLLHGAPALGLPVVDTLLWGGIFVSLLTALVGIVFSLPLGVLLALGRRSNLPVVRAASIVFIEFVRGVPFIAVLYLANNLLPLFLPAGWEPDRFIPPLVGTVLFAAAYMAEEVRGGLQTLDRGQYEAAMALGLGYWTMMRLVVLPQALTRVIPGLVNNVIGLFKDTTLVAIVGMTDFLQAMDNAFKDTAWSGPTILATGYVFAGLFYFVFCYGMSLYSSAMERRLAAGRKR